MSLDVAKFKRDTIELSRCLREISDRSFKNQRGNGDTYKRKRKRAGHPECHGDLKLCAAPWFPCASWFLTVNQVAAGKARLRCFCAEFKCKFDRKKSKGISYE